MLNVKLLILPVNVEAGIVCADEPPNTTVAEALLASMLPDVVLMDPLTVNVFAPTESVPEDNVSVPFMVGEALAFKLPFVVKLLNVVALPAKVPVPEKATVPVCALKVPLFVKAPPLAMVIVLPPKFKVDPEPTVKSKTLGDASKSIVTPAGIETTAVFEFGTPPHQLFAMFHSPSSPPIHVPLALTVTATLVLVALSQLETVWDA